MSILPSTGRKSMLRVSDSVVIQSENFVEFQTQKRIPNYHEDECEYFIHKIYELCSKYFILELFG